MGPLDPIKFILPDRGPAGADHGPFGPNYSPARPNQRLFEPDHGFVSRNTHPLHLIKDLLDPITVLLDPI